MKKNAQNTKSQLTVGTKITGKLPILSAFGTNPFGGIITQVITKTTDPQYYVGQVFVGYYHYSSTTVDGDFYATGLTHPADNNSLCGAVFMTFPDTHGKLNSLRSTRNDGHLVVSGGGVTNFEWSWENANYYVVFTETSFHSLMYSRVDPKTGAFLPDISTWGTVCFGAPVH